MPWKGKHKPSAELVVLTEFGGELIFESKYDSIFIFRVLERVKSICHRTRFENWY